MDKEYEYEEEYDDGLTFKKVGRFFKKGWLRMIIYAVVCVVLATAVVLPVKTFWKSEPVAQTTVEFVYDGIETGKAPDGSLFNSDNIIATTVLATAVEKANLQSVVTDISKLRQSTRVEAVNTDEYVALVQAAANGDTNAANTLRNYVMYPTSFNIVVSDPQKLGFSDSQAKVFLDTVVQCYYAYFLERYSVQDLLSDGMFTLSNSQSVEFSEVYDIYSVTLSSVMSTLVELAEANPNFVSREYNAGFASLVSDLSVIQNRLERFNSYITTNNIWYNKVSARESLIASRTKIYNELEPLEEYIETLSKQISQIQPNTTTSGQEGDKTITVSYPSEYFTFHERLDAANREVRAYRAKLAEIATLLDRLSDSEETPAALINAAQTSLKAIEADTTKTIEIANAVINDFYQNQFLVQSVRQTQPAIVTRRGLTFSMLTVYAVALIVGVLIACVVTGVKISSSNSARKKAEKRAEADNAKAEDGENK